MWVYASVCVVFIFRLHDINVERERERETKTTNRNITGIWKSKKTPFGKIAKSHDLIPQKRVFLVFGWSRVVISICYYVEQASKTHKITHIYNTHTLLHYYLNRTAFAKVMYVHGTYCNINNTYLYVPILVYTIIHVSNTFAVGFERSSIDSGKEKKLISAVIILWLKKKNSRTCKQTRKQQQQQQQHQEKEHRRKENSRVENNKTNDTNDDNDSADDKR